MSNLVVLGFDGMHTADDVLNKLRALQKDELIDLEDSCAAERDDAGKVYIKQRRGRIARRVRDSRRFREEARRHDSARLIGIVHPFQNRKRRQPYKPRVLRTSMSDENEQKLRMALSKAA